MASQSIANLRGKTNANDELMVAASVSVSGADGSILDGVDTAIKATVKDYANSNPLAVAIMDASGDIITSFGGGTQYAQGSASTDTDTLTMAGVERRDTPANPTGVADGDRTMPAVDSEGVLWTRARQQIDGDTGAGTVPTDIIIAGVAGSGGPISLIGGAGAVSAQVLRTTLASDDPAVTALQIIDDWDESDRAKVNPIAGQAGVAGGSGTVGATTQRVTLATDVALPAGTNAIGTVGGTAAGTATVTSVNDSATNQTLLSANTGRKGYKLFNDTTVTAYVKEGTTATTSDYSYQILAGGYYEHTGVGVYSGRIDCIWASDASGAMKVTELT